MMIGERVSNVTRDEARVEGILDEWDLARLEHERDVLDMEAWAADGLRWHPAIGWNPKRKQKTHETA